MSQWLSHRHSHTQKYTHTQMELSMGHLPPLAAHWQAPFWAALSDWACVCVCLLVCVFVTPSVGHAGSQLQQQSVISISTGLLCSGSNRPCPAAERSHQCAGTRSDTLCESSTRQFSYENIPWYSSTTILQPTLICISLSTMIFFFWFVFWFLWRVFVH